MKTVNNSKLGDQLNLKLYNGLNKIIPPTSCPFILVNLILEEQYGSF